MKGFFVLLLAVFAGFCLASTTTINSTLTQNSNFTLNSFDCVYDSYSNNYYCAANGTVYVTQNNTQYVNQTVYPSCANYSNGTIQLTYADFGIASFTDYSCHSGELVLAPPFPNSTVEASSCNETLNTAKFEKKLYCNTNNTDDRIFRHVDFDAHQYIDIEVADCSAPIQQTDFATLNSTAQADICQPFYVQGYNSKICQTPLPSAETNDAKIPDWFIYLLVVGVLAAGVYVVKSRGFIGGKSKAEPGDPKNLLLKRKKKDDDEAFD